MRSPIALMCVMAIFAGSAEASHVKVEAAKGKGRHAAVIAGMYTVKNGEKFPVDVCMSDSLTGPEKVELSPFRLERLDHGRWTAVARITPTVHFTYELRPAWVESYPITVRDAGRYRVVMEYGRDAPDDKGCDALLHGLTQVVRSRAFDVQ